MESWNLEWQIPIQGDIMNFESFSCQVRSLIYHMIIKPSHDQNCCNYAAHPMPSNFLIKMKLSESDKPPDIHYSHFAYLIFFNQAIWGQINYVTFPVISLWGNTENQIFLGHKPELWGHWLPTAASSDRGLARFFSRSSSSIIGAKQWGGSY